MKKTGFMLLFLLILFSPGFSQSNDWLAENAKAVFRPGKILFIGKDEDKIQAAKEFLKSRIPALSDKRTDLRLVNSNKSPMGRHFEFIQTFAGKDIFGSEVKLNMAEDGNIYSYFDKTIFVNAWPPKATFSAIDKTKLSSILGEGESDFREVYFVVTKGSVPAWQVDFTPKAGGAYTQVVLGLDYKVLFRKNMALNYRDTTVKAAVFMPDPLTSAHQNYQKGAPYSNHGDSDVSEINNERIIKDITVRRYQDVSGNDSFVMESPYIKLKDIDNPHNGTSYSSIPSFVYNRSSPSFEYANTYYHINAFQKHVQDLGMTAFSSRQIVVDPRGTTKDNSQFVPDKSNTTWFLYYGTGGVNDAEDADVIIHEYCHFLSHTASAFTVYGSERSAVEEGLCDYFACAYSKNIDPFNWQQSYNWDGHNEFWSGRSCTTKKKYPTDLHGDTYQDAELWTGALMDVEDSLGQDTTDLLMLTTLFTLGKNQKMSDIAMSFVQADSALMGGRHARLILERFVERGLLNIVLYKAIEKNDPANIHIISRYFNSEGLLNLEFNLSQKGNVSLYDLNGKELFNSSFEGSQLNIYRPELPQGIYILHINTNELQQVVKVFKN